MDTGTLDMRKLELRSGLFFEYPKLQLTDKNLIFFLPFWENPIITENKAARLVEYNLINRGSALFSHTGAEARTISIDFTLTLPHIMRSINSVLNSQRLIQSLSTDKEKKRFNNINPFEGEVPTTTAEDAIRQWKALVLENHLGNLETPDNKPLFAPGELDGDVSFLPDGPIVTTQLKDTGQVVRNVESRLVSLNESPTALKAMNTAVYILEVIRSCVAGNSTNTVLGPPVLRLRHGASYSDVPLICRSYNIEVDQDAGYDLKTLLPHRTTITLDCAELRTGDFETFEPGKPVARDTIAGWEAVQHWGTTDPGYLK